MKKSAALAAAMLMLASPAMAYENPHAGYSVKDKTPFYIAETNRVYAFSDIKATDLESFDKMEEGTIHVSSYYTAREMEQVTGAKFSTAYFDAQYEKIALLERSGLNTRSVAFPMLDFNSYEKIDSLSSVYDSPAFKEQMKQLEPVISTTKVGKYNGITVSYLYKQKYTVIAMDTTLVSANDRLYMLTTISVDEKTFAPVQEPAWDESKDADTVEIYTDPGEQVEEAVEAAEDVAEAEIIGGADAGTAIEISEDDIAASAEPVPEMTMGEFRKALKEATKLEKINAADLDPKLVKKFVNNHKKYIKSFKAITPVAKQKPLVYHDAILNKTITLPDNWFYGQINMADKEIVGNITLAGSMDMARKMNKTLCDSGIFQDFYFGYDDPSIPDDTPVSVVMSAQEKKYTETTRQLMKDFDAMLITGSLQTKDPEFQQMLAHPRTMQVEADMFLRDMFIRAQNMPNTEKYFKLNDYKYILDFSDVSGLIDIYMNTTILEESNFIHQVRLACNNASFSGMWFVKNEDYQVEEAVTASLQQWQF